MSTYGIRCRLPDRFADLSRDSGDNQPRTPIGFSAPSLPGPPRTVTVANQGRFVEYWDGLDENFMPLPPGSYGVKGIYMTASKWAVDGEYHSIAPRFAGGPSCWLPAPQQVKTLEPFGGDPCSAHRWPLWMSA